jgi:hypothetical protein
MSYRRAYIIQRRVAIGATAVGATAAASGQLDKQRRPLLIQTAPDFSTGLANLKTYGVSVVDSVVDQSVLTAVKDTSVYQCMPLSKQPRPRRGQPHPAGYDPSWRLSAPGRYHRREETFDEHDVKAFERVEKAIWPLVEAFFEEDDEGTADIFRSEMQILNAIPGSTSQTWHSDNRSRGLSIIVPLVPFTTGNGPTQVLVGSHRQDMPLVAQHGAQVVVAPVGSIAAYDSRSYHRGLGNETDEGRPALIFCYDRIASPPPGYSGVFGSVAHAYLAGLLNVVSAAAAMLGAGASAAPSAAPDAT